MIDSLLPVFWRLTGRSCLVVGGGPVAWAKATRLREAGAWITLVAPFFHPAPASLQGDAAVETILRSFEPDDLNGRALVIAATDDPAVQREVSGRAAALGIPCNVVDVPELCDFTFGAVLRRGPLQVAISTNGQFPLLAQRLRDRLDAQLPATVASTIEILSRSRRELYAEGTGYAERHAELSSLLDEEMIAAVLRGDTEAVRCGVDRWEAARAVAPCSTRERVDA